MSKANNLRDFLNDLAPSIKTKAGLTGQTLNAQNFKSAVDSITPGTMGYTALQAQIFQPSNVAQTIDVNCYTVGVQTIAAVPYLASGNLTSTTSSKSSVNIFNSPTTTAIYIYPSINRCIYWPNTQAVKINAPAQMTLPTITTTTQPSGISQAAVITPSSTVQYLTIPTGYLGTSKYYKINAGGSSTKYMTFYTGSPESRTLIAQTEFTASMENSTWYEYLNLGPGLTVPGIGTFGTSMEGSYYGDVWIVSGTYSGMYIKVGNPLDDTVHPITSGYVLMAAGDYYLGG